MRGLRYIVSIIKIQTALGNLPARRHRSTSFPVGSTINTEAQNKLIRMASTYLFMIDTPLYKYKWLQMYQVLLTKPTFHLGFDGLRGGCDAGDHATAACGHEDGVQLRHLL